jgi:hypothetical protein
VSLSRRPAKATGTRRGTALRKLPVYACARNVNLTPHSRYFCNPNFKSHIEAIPGTYAQEEEKKYPGINSGEYLVKRLTATY